MPFGSGHFHEDSIIFNQKVCHFVRKNQKVCYFTHSFRSVRVRPQNPRSKLSLRKIYFIPRSSFFSGYALVFNSSSQSSPSTTNRGRKCEHMLAPHAGIHLRGNTLAEIHTPPKSISVSKFSFVVCFSSLNPQRNKYAYDESIH